MKSRALWNLLSVALACCIAGLYLIGYMWHIFNQVDQMYIPNRPLKIVVEESPTLVELNIFPKILAEDTYIKEEEIEVEEPVNQVWNGLSLTASKGVVFGPSGKETWYNLPMDRVIKSMRNRGYTEAEYPYDIREDGVKILGDYVMVAADLNEYNKGDLIETSLGTGIVCDTGDFASTTDVKIDIATNW